MKDVSSLNENKLKELIFHMCVTTDTGGLWDRNDKIESIDYINKKGFSHVTINELFVKFGEGFITEIFENIIKIRIGFLRNLILIHKLNDNNIDCHLCKKNKIEKTFDFMMGQLIHSEKNRAQFFAVNTLSTVALLAGAKGKFILRPEGHKQYKTIKLQLGLCSNCLEQRKNFFGKIKLRESDYEKHPSLEIAQHIGYNVLIPNKDIHKYR